jgi:hypothetical protein
VSLTVQIPRLTLGFSGAAGAGLAAAGALGFGAGFETAFSAWW